MKTTNGWLLYSPERNAFLCTATSNLTTPNTGDAAFYPTMRDVTLELETRAGNPLFVHPVPAIETITKEVKAAQYADEQVWSAVLGRYMTIHHFLPATGEIKRTVREADLIWK